MTDPDPYADMVVTYTDGFVETLPGVRFQASLGEGNPVKYKEGVLEVENINDEILYRVAVRGWTFLHPEPVAPWLLDEPPF